MTQWNDLFLRMPLPESWQNGLLFVSFGVHLLFVLLMLARRCSACCFSCKNV